MAIVWLLPIVLGSVWPLLFAFRWHKPILALLDAGALLAAAAAYVFLSPAGAKMHSCLAVTTACLTAVAALSGGLASPKAIWLFLIPLAAALWSSRRATAVWTAITALVFLLLPYLGAAGRAAGFTMPADYHEFGLWLSLMTQLVFVVSVLTANETSRSRAWRSMVHKQAELEDDITARLRAEAQLRLAEARYRSLVEQMPAITYTSALSGTAAGDYVSPQVEAVLGFSASEWLSSPDSWILHLHPEDRDGVVAEFRRCLETTQPFRMEYRFLARDGRVVWVRDESVVVRDGAGAPILLQGIMSDISEHKRLEDRLIHSQKMETVGRLAGGIAHDFNNLLTVIAGNAAFALEGLPLGSPEDVRGDLEDVLKAAERAKNLTWQLLTFARHQVVELRVISLNDLIVDMDKMLRRLIGEHIELVTLPMPGLGFVKVDAGQMEQVLVNLAVNARDAMPQGGTLTIETGNVTLSEADALRNPDARPGDFVMLAVSDTGCGMSEEVQAHLFEPFFTTKERGKGTGLGLSTVYGVVRQHGGAIWVRSERGRGSVFEIHLPRVDEQLDSSCNATSPAASRGRETVLVAEDEACVRAVATRILQRLGYYVLEASNGEQALQIASRHQGRIDLLLTDVVMPRMSGKQLADELKQARPNVQVVFVSGYTDDRIGRNGVLDEDTAYLPKPFTEATLARKVRQVLDGARTVAADPGDCLSTPPAGAEA